MTDQELWAAVHGYEGLYEVSSHGRVRSLDRIIVGRWGEHRRRGCMRRFGNSKGYRNVTLCRRGVTRCVYVHDLVAAAFVGPKPVGCQVRHENGDRYANRPDNLRYGTALDNARDRDRHGHTARGVAHYRVRLTETAVRAIECGVAVGVSLAALAREFGVSHGSVSDIKHRRHWGCANAA